MPNFEKHFNSGNNPCKYFDSVHNYCNWVKRRNEIPEGEIPLIFNEMAMACTCYCRHPSECSNYEDYIRIDRQESESNSGNCYIATVCYGSYNCPQVITFRNFRDTYLNKTFSGRTFIKIYYALSPLIADWLKNKNRINAFIRVNILERIYNLLKRKAYS